MEKEYTEKDFERAKRINEEINKLHNGDNSLLTNAYNNILDIISVLSMDYINSGNIKYKHISDKLLDAKRAFEEDTKQTKYCSNCGTKLMWWDTQGIQIHHMGYGSKYDLEVLNIKLCAECTDKVIDMVKDKSL